MRRTPILVAISAVISNLFGIGCGSSPAPAAAGETCSSPPPLTKKATYKVGFVQIYEVGNPWRTTNTDDMVAEAMARGDELVFNPPTVTDAQEQVSRMQDLINAKVDAIILCP